MQGQLTQRTDGTERMSACVGSLKQDNYRQHLALFGPQTRPLLKRVSQTSRRRGCKRPVSEHGRASESRRGPSEHSLRRIRPSVGPRTLPAGAGSRPDESGIFYNRNQC